MARITVEDCIDKFESRFELVLVASNRARKLHSGESPTIEKDNDKPTVIALREIADESIPVDSLKEKLIQEYQIVSPLDEEELSLDYVDSEIETQNESTQDELQSNVSIEDEVVDDKLLNDDTNIIVEDDTSLASNNDENSDISENNNP